MADEEVPGVPHIWIPGVDDVKKHTDHYYGNAKHERQPHGLIFVNGQEVGTTLQCPHCAKHFLSVKGSGHRRSFCFKCMAVTCGKKECMESCTPFVEELERTQGRVL